MARCSDLSCVAAIVEQGTKMEPKELKDYVSLIIELLVFIISGTIAWNRLTSKVNGLGGRVKRVEESCANSAGRMDRFERELADYRRDASDAVSRMGRVEKGLEMLAEEISNGNLGIGSQLHNIEKLIGEKDLETQKRLVRIETISRIEQKLGRPLID